MFLKKILNLIILYLILIFLFTTLTRATPNESFTSLLKENGKIIFIRHAYAPGNGDPDNFNLLDCATQRNLNSKGIADSKNIKIFFNKNKIEIDKILTSEWCRCKDTAKYAFENFEVKSFLNSFYSKKFSHNKSNQIYELRDYIQKWNGKNNLIFVTHYVVILEILNLSVSSGEIIVTDKELNILARQKTSNN